MALSKKDLERRFNCKIERVEVDGKKIWKTSQEISEGIFRPITGFTLLILRNNLEAQNFDIIVNNSCLSDIEEDNDLINSLFFEDITGLDSMGLSKDEHFNLTDELKWMLYEEQLESFFGISAELEEMTDLYNELRKERE